MIVNPDCDVVPVVIGLNVSTACQKVGDADDEVNLNPTSPAPIVTVSLPVNGLLNAMLKFPLTIYVLAELSFAVTVVIPVALIVPIPLNGNDIDVQDWEEYVAEVLLDTEPVNSEVSLYEITLVERNCGRHKSLLSTTN